MQRVDEAAHVSRRVCALSRVADETENVIHQFLFVVRETVKAVARLLFPIEDAMIKRDAVRLGLPRRLPAGGLSHFAERENLFRRRLLGVRLRSLGRAGRRAGVVSGRTAGSAAVFRGVQAALKRFAEGPNFAPLLI